jgi:hypothetical protein
MSVAREIDPIEADAVGCFGTRFGHKRHHEDGNGIGRFSRVDQIRGSAYLPWATGVLDQKGPLAAASVSRYEIDRGTLSSSRLA